MLFRSVSQSRYQLQTANTSPIDLILPDGVNSVCIIAAFITGAPNGTPGTFTFNRVILGDGATLNQCLLDLQAINSSLLSTGLTCIFSPGTYSNFANGGKIDKTRPITLRTTADDLTGTGDFEITIYYILLPTQ